MPKVLLKTHQSTLETVASLVTLELRPFKPSGGGGIGVVPRYPDDLDREEKRAIHRSDVLFWLDQPEKTGWLLNGLPVNAIDSGMVKFAGLAIETNQLFENGRTQEATRQVIIKGRVNVINYTRQPIPELTPLVMGAPDDDPATRRPEFYQGRDPRRRPAVLRPAFEVVADGRDAQWFTEQYTPTLPVSHDLVYVSMKLHRAPGSGQFPASSFLAPQRRSYYPEIASLDDKKQKDPKRFYDYQFDHSETSRALVKNLVFFETLMDFVQGKIPLGQRFDRVRLLVRKHVTKGRLPKLAVHLDLGVVPLLDEKRKNVGLRFKGPLPNLYRVIASSLYVTPPGAIMTVHL